MPFAKLIAQIEGADIAHIGKAHDADLFSHTGTHLARKRAKGHAADLFGVDLGVIDAK